VCRFDAKNDDVSVEATGSEWQACIAHLVDDGVRGIVINCRLQNRSQRTARILWCGDNVARRQRVDLPRIRMSFNRLVSVGSHTLFDYNHYYNNINNTNRTFRLPLTPMIATI
jgi:hypothetical protein